MKRESDIAAKLAARRVFMGGSRAAGYMEPGLILRGISESVKIGGSSRRSIEFPGVWTYSIHADEFVRPAVRKPEGRREEWAYSPLFLWGKIGVFSAGVLVWVSPVLRVIRTGLMQ